MGFGGLFQFGNSFIWFICLIEGQEEVVGAPCPSPAPPALNRLSYLSSSHHLDSVKPDKMSDVKEGLSVTLSACVSCLFNFSQHWWLSKFLLSSKLACRHYRWVANKQNKPEIRTSRLCPLTSLHACSSALINPSPRSTFYTAGFN